MRINAVRACNLACTYCFVRQNTGPVRDSKVPLYMSEEILKASVDFLTDRYGKFSQHCVIGFGLTGEPFLRIDLFNLLEHYAQKRFANSPRTLTLVFGVTNGTLLTPDNVRDLGTRGYEFAISIDGPKDIHDQQRTTKNGSGSYDRILAGLPDYWKHVRHRWAIAIMSPERPEVLRIFQHLSNLGFNKISMEFSRTLYDYDLTNSYLTKAKDSYDEFLQFLLNLSEETRHVAVSQIAHGYDRFGAFIAKLLRGSGMSRRCRAGLNEISVDTNGDIYPCDSFTGLDEFKIGDVFSGIADGKDDIFCDLTINNPGLSCYHCEFRLICGTVCPYRNYLGGSLSRMNTFDCVLNKYLISLAMRLITEGNISLFRLPKEALDLPK